MLTSLEEAAVDMLLEKQGEPFDSTEVIDRLKKFLRN
jgi:hypothetical protein